MEVILDSWLYLWNGFPKLNSAQQSWLDGVKFVCVAKLHIQAIVPTSLTLNSPLINDPIQNIIHALARNHDLYGNTNLNETIHQSWSTAISIDENMIRIVVMETGYYYNCCHWKKPAESPSEASMFMLISMWLSWLQQL